MDDSSAEFCRCELRWNGAYSDTSKHWGFGFIVYVPMNFEIRAFGIGRALQPSVPIDFGISASGLRRLLQPRV